MTNKYSSQIKNYHKDISDFFGFYLENIKIIVAESRVEYEKLLNRKTADWEIGNTNLSKKTILLLDPDQWIKDAPSHKPEEFPYLSKHEIIHIYVDHLLGGRTIPMWLSEGLAGAISEQYKNAKNKYFEMDFCSKLDTPYNWNQRLNSGAYQTAFLFTRHLIDKYKFVTVEKLLKSATINYSYYRFNKIILNIFKKNITELEQEFLDTLQ